MDQSLIPDPSADDEDVERIHDTLHEVETDRDVTVLGARDYGSRMTKTESPESDFDVMFLYVPEYEDLVVGAEKDVIDDKSYGDDDLELHGWSLSKFLGRDSGLLGSNPQGLAFVMSDEYYYTAEDIALPLFRVCKYGGQNFVPYALIRHYRSLARANYMKYIKGYYKLASGHSYDDFLDHVRFHDSEMGSTHVDPEATEIRDDFVMVNATAEMSFGSQLDIEEAIDAGLVEETTTDRTVKRNMNIIDALLRARYVEETGELPPTSFLDLFTEYLGQFNESEASMVRQLYKVKTTPSGQEVGNPLENWIEYELDREIPPEPHTNRHPDADELRDQAKDIVDRL